jgi:hypothetical protein
VKRFVDSTSRKQVASVDTSSARLIVRVGVVRVGIVRPISSPSISVLVSI